MSQHPAPHPAHKGHVEPTATINRDSHAHPPLHPREKIPNNPSLIVTKGLSRKPLRDIYPYLLSASWPRLMAIIIVGYLATNALFAVLFWLDPGGIENVRPGSYPDAFFFSVQTFGTIGYGRMSPITTFSHVLVTVESLTSLVSVAILTGIIFSKFSRPTARVMFSKVAVTNTWDGLYSLVIRIANERGTQIGDAQLTLTLNRLETTADGGLIRRTYDLPLTRSRNPNFMFAWTVIHVLDEKSPLHGQTPESLIETDAVISASLAGVDEVYNQTVYARHRYVAEDIRFKHDFVSILERNPDGGRIIDYTHFHDSEPEEA